MPGPFWSVPLPKHLSRVRVPVNTPDGWIRPEATESGGLVTHSMELMETDAAIVRRAIEGDERAMRLLWNQHAPHVDAVVRRLAGDPDLAQDIAQEVWIQIFRALPSWRGDAKFSTWIHRVAINRTLNALRRVKRLAAAETGIEEDSAVVEQDADRSLLAQSIEAAMPTSASSTKPPAAATLQRNRRSKRASARARCSATCPAEEASGVCIGVGSDVRDQPSAAGNCAFQYALTCSASGCGRGT